MSTSHADEWQALAEHYRGMVDEQLLELAAEYGDLRPLAQQALRDEMRLRKLGDPQAQNPPRPAWRLPPATPTKNQAALGASRFGFSVVGHAPDLVTEAPQPEDDPAQGPVEYTWKTPLCSCASDEQAWQISEVLRRAGIESWIEGAGTYANSSGSQEMSIDDGSRRVLVAADQLDEARGIVAQPIPADIVEQSKTPPPEYEAPVCPTCGAADPLLEDVEPVNAWKCEACGAEWVEDRPDEVEEA